MSLDRHESIVGAPQESRKPGIRSTDAAQHCCTAPRPAAQSRPSPCARCRGQVKGEQQRSALSDNYPHGQQSRASQAHRNMHVLQARRDAERAYHEDAGTEVSHRKPSLMSKIQPVQLFVMCHHTIVLSRLGIHIQSMLMPARPIVARRSRPSDLQMLQM